jgi:hypothetical protein
MLRPVLRRILEWCFRNNVILQAEHIPGVENFKADMYSRFIDKDDWKLHREVVQDVFATLGTVDIDRMTSSWSAVVFSYNALYWDVEALVVDCFSQNWKSVRNWVFSPFGLVGKALTHLKFCQAWAIMVVPVWTA